MKFIHMKFKATKSMRQYNVIGNIFTNFNAENYATTFGESCYENKI